MECDETKLKSDRTKYKKKNPKIKRGHHNRYAYTDMKLVIQFF